MMTDEEAARLIGLPTATFPSWTQGVLITDTHQDDNPIIYANAGFSRLTGYGLEEILGRNCRFLQGEGTDPGTVVRIRQAIAYRRGFQGDPQLSPGWHFFPQSAYDRPGTLDRGGPILHRPAD